MELPSFNEMIDDLYSNLNNNKSSKLVLPNLNLNITTTNTYFKNAKDVLKTMRCNPDHCVKYFNNELNGVNWLTSSKKDGLVIKGKVKKEKIKLLLQQYIQKYICCNICNSLDTIIVKEKRMEFLKCKTCKSQYNIN